MVAVNGNISSRGKMNHEKFLVVKKGLIHIFLNR